MLDFYKTSGTRMDKLEEPVEGCWINAVSPTEAEMRFLTDELGLDADFVRSALDEEESSRIEKEDEQTLVIVDTPMDQTGDGGNIPYSTMPIGIIITEKYVVTVCLRNNPVIEEMATGKVRNMQTPLKTRFLLLLLLKIATKFLQYLKQIDKRSNMIESQLHRSMKNKELIELLGLEKSLVFFSTSLKSNEVTLEKVLRGRVIKLYEEDEDPLEDVLIEVKQAIEMANIYSSILSGTMDAFASVISNNLNIVMKALTSITILMAIPNMVSGFYGMNVDGLPLAHVWFPSLLIMVLCVVVAVLLNKKDMF